jgi:hypothetical protein
VSDFNRRTALAALLFPLPKAFAAAQAPARRAGDPDVNATGARGDGVADDTAAIQKALDVFSGKPRSGRVYVPTGVYRVTKTLTYRGNVSEGLNLEGSVSASGPSGAVLRWDGPAGGTVLRLAGAVDTRVSNLAIDGRGKARHGVVVAYDGDRKAGASNVTLEHLAVGGCVGDGSAAILLGADGDQCDAIRVIGCKLVGHGAPGTTRYGILTNTSNCKNFSIRDCVVVGFQVGISHGGSGFCRIDGLACSSNTTADVRASTTHLSASDCNSEGSARLLVGGTGANPGSVLLSNWSWDSSLTPDDDVIVSYSGFLRLTGNHLFNRKSPTSLPKVRLGAHQDAPSVLISEGNHYFQATGTAPLVDGSDRDLFTNYADGGIVRLRSFGDYGGRAGSLVRLKDAEIRNRETAPSP